MSRISIFNMAWGFFLLFVAACGGVFVALRLTEAFVGQNLSPTWQSVLETSSHGHTSLFGIIHILLGLTIPYDGQTQRVRNLKTCALLCGSVAMGPLMLARASLGPTLSTEWNGLVIGVALSLALFGLLFNSIDLFRRIAVRG